MSCLGRTSELEKDIEWRRKSVRLREGEFLHGELQVEIQEAKDLPDTDNFLFNIKRCFGQEKDVTDPYVAVFLDNTRIITTSVVYNNLCPQWNEFFRVSVCHHAKKLLFRVKDQDELGTDNVGEVGIDLSELMDKPGRKIHGWEQIVDHNGCYQGQLFLKVVYRPNLEYKSPRPFECPDCYFPQRTGNHVTLYACARNSDQDQAIPVNSTDSVSYSPPSLWIDMFKAFVASERFIYIAGWSLNTKIKLLRGDDWTMLKTQDELDMSSMTLGELLKRKAEVGVRVLVMIWGETTSIMGTHDTETENYFKGSRVFVARVARQTKTREYKDLNAHFTANLGYSHHQKSVIMDAEPNKFNSKGRRIVAFVGGIDLTDGRYDTPSHPIYQTLGTIHEGDFYQPCGPGVRSNVGPRLPWQDIHARVEGSAARDIMLNFVERWGKERPLNSRLLIQNVDSKDFDFCSSESDKFHHQEIQEQELRHNQQQQLQNRYQLQQQQQHQQELESEESSRLLNNCHNQSEKSSSRDDEPIRNWDVQVFRSITSDSARFQLENETSFTTKKGRSVDNSIARAYTNAIRGAKRFIYIENQYFIGSSYGWMDDQDVHCYNVIPMEVTQKICESIEAGRRFIVYIVIPLHPEGIPTDNAIQEILFWQRRTMQMMYTRIAQAIHAAGSKAHPTDYLMFFCLGKKEKACDIPFDLAHPRMGTWMAKMRKSRRMMIYIHSKLMIVDDVYLLVGSANINQRSLDGDRDSELAIGACQPEYMNISPHDDQEMSRGEIFKFRMSLFHDHLSRFEPAFADPRSEECSKLIKELAEKNWKDFVDKHKDPEAFLLTYPVDIEVVINEDIPVVKLSAKTKNKCFPDTKARILGKPAKSIPNKLTT